MGTLKKRVEKQIRYFLSPTFIAILLLSFALWYVSKLRYTYRTEIPTFVKIENNNIKLMCIAEGTGYQLLGYKFFTRHRMSLPIKDVQLSPSATNKNHFIIDKLSLQNAISRKNSDVKILSIGEVPEIIIPEQIEQ